MIRLGLLASVTRRTVSMLGKKHWESAVVADSKEIDRLSTYISGRKTARTFLKKMQTEFVGNAEPLPGKQQTPPFHYLRNDLNVLLGPSGTKLLINTWSKYHLSPAERTPQRLRQALVRLFAVAARVAAPRGVGQALKRLVSDFERLYFPIVENPQAEPTHQKARRFALLTVIQSGRGDDLLSHLLGERTSDRRRPSLPSRLISDDHQVARRKFLFEQACRAKSWSDAYRQARLLSSCSDSQIKQTLEPRFLQVCQTLAKHTNCSTKKKQLLVDLAFSTQVSQEHKLDFALKAASAPIKSCRPGEVERLVCDLLSPSDPRWRLALGRLYRHKAQSEQWMTDFRTLWQAEPSLQPKLKLLLNQLRLPRVRVEKAMSQRSVSGRFRQLPSLTTFRARLQKTREEVRYWQALLPPAEEVLENGRTTINLPQDVWAFISHVSSQLDVQAPIYARTNFQAQPAILTHYRSKKLISFSPDFFTYDPEEQRFLLARSLFRGACGLDALEARLGSLDTPKELARQTLAFVEWNGHESSALEELEPETCDFDTLLVVLEELFWSTHEEAYLRFAEVAHRRCWCPLFEAEPDIFASSFVDVVGASFALVKTLDDSHGPSKVSSAYGLGALFDDHDRRRVLALRLQRLWMNYLFSTDQLDYQM